nr:MAG TPA: hypothetical protein [Caudoviricetes sp.]
MIFMAIRFTGLTSIKIDGILKMPKLLLENLY